MTKNLFSAGVLIILLAFTSISFAQLDLPRPSPGAKVTQTVGLTDITIDYSSPGVKDRKIFGGLLPFGEMWRTGANAATKLTISKDITAVDFNVPGGTYSLFTIPGEKTWTVIINKDENASMGSYKKENDLIRFDVPTATCGMRERMAFSVENFDDNNAEIVLEWETTRIVIPIGVNTSMQAAENIESYLGRTWRDYNSAARYYLALNSSLEKGLGYADQSLALNVDWFNTWTKAELLKAMGKKDDAYKFAVKAQELGNASSNFFFKDQVDKAVISWSPTGSKKTK